MRFYVGTVVANDRNGRVVEMPENARLLKVADVGGKNGGGVKIDYMVEIFTVEDAMAKTNAQVREFTPEQMEEMLEAAREQAEVPAEAVEAVA